MESKIAEVMASRRKYEVLIGKCNVLSQMKNNKNLKFFGNNSDDGLAQMAAYRIFNDKSEITEIQE